MEPEKGASAPFFALNACITVSHSSIVSGGFRPSAFSQSARSTGPLVYRSSSLPRMKGTR